VLFPAIWQETHILPHPLIFGICICTEQSIAPKHEADNGGTGLFLRERGGVANDHPSLQLIYSVPLHSHVPHRGVSQSPLSLILRPTTIMHAGKCCPVQQLLLHITTLVNLLVNPSTMRERDVGWEGGQWMD
jgi:hypothetical protein